MGARLLPSAPTCTSKIQHISPTELRCARPKSEPRHKKQKGADGGGRGEKKKKRWRERQERKISSWLRLTIANSSFPLGREGTASSLGECTPWTWAKRSGGEHPQPIPPTPTLDSLRQILSAPPPLSMRATATTGLSPRLAGWLFYLFFFAKED